MVPDDSYFMLQALREAQIALEEDEVPIGAVIVVNNKIIARGHNQVETLSDPTAHAEILAITSACNSLGSKYLMGASLYVTVEPCLMCCGAMYWSKLSRIVYGAPDTKNGYRRTAGTAWPFHPKATLSAGVLQNECVSIIQEFFKSRR